MADVKKVMDILYKVEFSNPNDVLEKNKYEDGWTFMGIYQKANPDLDLWKIIRQKMQQYNGDMKLVGSMLYDNPIMREYVAAFYKREYWDRMKLDQIESQHVANEMMIFGVNAGVKAAIKLAQRAAGVVQDGVIGPNTLKALNRVDEKVFSQVYDELEQEHYEKLVYAKPELKIYARGWKNRSEVV